MKEEKFFLNKENIKKNYKHMDCSCEVCCNERKSIAQLAQQHLEGPRIEIEELTRKFIKEKVRQNEALEIAIIETRDLLVEIRDLLREEIKRIRRSGER